VGLGDRDLLGSARGDDGRYRGHGTHDYEDLERPAHAGRIIIGMLMTRPRALKLAALAACAAGLAACGHTQGIGPDRTLRTALTEYRLRPDNIRASAGHLHIQLRHYRRVTHNHVISSHGVTHGSSKPVWPAQH